MAPFTHFGFAVGTAPDGHARFESLEFIDTNGPMPVSIFHPGQVLRLGDLDYTTRNIHFYDEQLSSLKEQNLL
jgi:hypothetical protein